MGDKVSRFPASACRHFESGRCLYEERLNPGLREPWRCSVLAEWERAYDDFLLRAEAFHLEPEKAMELWEARLERLMIQARQCPDFVDGPQDTATGCANELESLCLVLLPRCEGHCRHYSLAPPDHDNPGQRH